MSTNFMQYLNINTNIVAASTTGSASKQVLLIGQRNTSGTLYLADNGYTQPNYYIPILLPSFASGSSSLSYLSNYGIKSQLGYGFTLPLPAPTRVVSSLGITTLTWTTIPYGFSQLIGFALSGTLTQSSISGTPTGASISGGQAIMTISGTVAFTTSGAMTLSGTNNIAYPDPNLSDPIALMVWDFYQTYLSANTAASGVPSAYISILSDRDVTITPINTPIVLQIPTTVIINSDESVSLEFAYTGGVSTLDNFGYLPTTAYGSTTITQLTSDATGTYDGMIISPETSTTGIITINIKDVVGTFVTTTDYTLSVVLDNTINVFNFLNNIDLYGAVQQFPINSLTNITTTYADFYNGCASLNASDQALNNHYGTYAIAGNINSLPQVAGSLPIANDNTKILVTYPYVAQFGDIPYDNTAKTVGSGRVASAVAYMLANGDYTQAFPALTGATINHLPVSSISDTTSYSTTSGGSGNIAVGQGWLPLAPNSSGVVKFLQSNTTMTTLPGTSVPDTEFRYTHIWDCVRYIRYEVAQLYLYITQLSNNQGTVLISTAFLTQFKNGIIAILYKAQSYGIVQNVALYESLVTVVQDSVNPNQVDASIPTQMIAQLNGADINITVFSSLYNFSTN